MDSRHFADTDMHGARPQNMLRDLRTLQDLSQRLVGRPTWLLPRPGEGFSCAPNPEKREGRGASSSPARILPRRIYREGEAFSAQCERALRVKSSPPADGEPYACPLSPTLSCTSVARAELHMCMPSYASGDAVHNIAFAIKSLQ